MSKLSRRQFLLAGAAVTVGGAGAVDAFGVEAGRVYVTRHDLPVPGLDPRLDGLRIAQVSDVHLHGGGLHAAAQAAIELLQSERPEIVLHTGDSLEDQKSLPDLTTFAKSCGTGTCAVAVLGNWEYAAGVTPQEAEKVYSAAGVELLVNRTRRVSVRGATLAIVGFDDPVLGVPDLGSALRDSTPADAAIWVFHAPGYADVMERVFGAKPALMLAGHTHGGQIRFPLVPPVKPYGAGRFVEGWYDTEPGRLYVSRGVGTTTIRARFRCPAEIPIFTLRAKS
jgi:predicted MPP superfamily phosphohydrolase